MSKCELYGVVVGSSYGYSNVCGGEDMPAGEEMFNYHGYSGPCPANDQVNPVADICPTTPEAEARNSGSTAGSFSAIDYQTPEPFRKRIVEAIGVNGFKPICLDQDTTENTIQSGDWMRESFQPIIDRYGLECGDATGWSFKIHEWDFILATLHLDGKWFEGLPTEHSVFELVEGTRVQIDGLPYFVKGRAEVTGFVKPNSLACEARCGELSATNDQVNPVGGEMPPPQTACTPTRVERLVRFLRLVATIAIWPLRVLKVCLLWLFVRPPNDPGNPALFLFEKRDDSRYR